MNNSRSSNILLLLEESHLLHRSKIIQCFKVHSWKWEVQIVFHRNNRQLHRLRIIIIISSFWIITNRTSKAASILILKIPAMWREGRIWITKAVTTTLEVRLVLSGFHLLKYYDNSWNFHWSMKIKRIWMEINKNFPRKCKYLRNSK